MVGRYGPLVPADEFVEEACLFDADPVAGEGAGRRIVILVTDHVWQVLDERASSEHVENLHAPADGEHRQAHALGREQQRQLAFVSGGSGLLGSMMALCPVAGRVDVRAAREQQAVQTAEEGVERQIVLSLDREDDWVGACARERLHVLGRDQRRLLVPDAPRRLLVVGGDADNGTHGTRLGLDHSGVT